MKTINIFIYLILLLLSVKNYSQDNITIFENNYADICGKTIIVDGIWFNEGIIRADISILTQKNAKPITGGYKKGDEITISSGEGCTYYIFSITKSGLNESTGSVTLSKTPPLMPVQKCDDFITFYEGGSYAFDTLDWNFFSVEEQGGLLAANINVSYRTNLISNLKIKKGDILWLGECAYKTERIVPKSKDNVKDPQGHYEINPAEIVFTKIESYFYDTTEIHGELNPPNIKSEYIIRKVLIYKGKRPTEEELKETKSKIWLLKIFYTARGMASRVMHVERDGKKILVEVDPIKTFNDESEALSYAKENGITDIKFEEE